MIIYKRDGTQVSYDLEKISIAISGAFNDVGFAEFDDANVLKSIEEELKKLRDITVEDVQDIVEDVLIEYGYIKEAKAYIQYRYEHSKQRERQKQFEQLIHSKLRADNIQNQNANVDEKSFGGRIGEASNEMMKKIALDQYVSPKAKENHEGNMIYIHDLDHYAVGNHNCLSIPFDDLLANGFNTRQTDVRPANSVNTAMQLVAVIFQLQSLQQFGGVSATHLDWTMVPYVRKSFAKHYADGVKYIEQEGPWDSKESQEWSIEDLRYNDHPWARDYAWDKTVQEVHQAAEGLYHNLNTLQSRSGN